METYANYCTYRLLKNRRIRRNIGILVKSQNTFISKIIHISISMAMKRRTIVDGKVLRLYLRFCANRTLWL